MKKILYFLILPLLLVSCSLDEASFISHYSSEIDKPFIYSLAKDDFYSKYGGTYVFTWVNLDYEQQFGCLYAPNPGGTNYLHSFEKMKYIQEVVPLTFNETKIIIDNYFDTIKYEKSMFEIYIIKLPFIIDESFYYQNYLVNFPAKDFFVQDIEMYRDFGYTKGYSTLKKQGFVS